MRYKKVMDGLSHLVISAAKQFWSVLPEGSRLPDDVWQKRYSFLRGLTWCHAIVIALTGFDSCVAIVILHPKAL